jgi:hypothetical protein
VIAARSGRPRTGGGGPERLLVVVPAWLPWPIVALAVIAGLLVAAAFATVEADSRRGWAATAFAGLSAALVLAAVSVTAGTAAAAIGVIAPPFGDGPVTPSRCIRAWNHTAPAWLRRVVADARATRASVRVTRQHDDSDEFVDCEVVFLSDRTAVWMGADANGGIGGWDLIASERRTPADSRHPGRRARVRPDGTLDER